MKIYISIPITGRDLKDVAAEIESTRRHLRGIAPFKNAEIISPLEVSSDPEATYAEHMGRDITALLQCDAIALCPGWEESRGCRLENETAKIYKKQRFKMPDKTLEIIHISSHPDGRYWEP